MKREGKSIRRGKLLMSTGGGRRGRRFLTGEKAVLRVGGERGAKVKERKWRNVFREALRSRSMSLTFLHVPLALAYILVFFVLVLVLVLVTEIDTEIELTVKVLIIIIIVPFLLFFKFLNRNNSTLADVLHRAHALTQAKIRVAIKKNGIFRMWDNQSRKHSLLRPPTHLGPPPGALNVTMLSLILILTRSLLLPSGSVFEEGGKAKP
jgi:hypothetical protein